MWDLSNRNRGIFLLISVLSGSAVLYNAWGAILALIISITIVIYVCYSLIKNDTVIAPDTLFVFVKYLNEIFHLFISYSNTAIFYLSSTIHKLYIILNNYYQTHLVSKMNNRFRRNNYQLSNNDTQDSTSNSSRFDLITNQLSPISRTNYQENVSYINQVDYSSNKITSTPIPPFHKDANSPANGGIGLYTPPRQRRQETQLSYGPNSNSIRSSDTVFNPDKSPWGTSISPKIRSKASGVKTVQTVAGPLLASTRYNIDPKVYSDVTSPGLSVRLAKYATEANMKLTHQSQYGTGQFPKVNLNASPLPLISVRNTKMRTPVTVRIAPPEASRYSPPERQKVISDVCKAESKASPSVVQVLREISLKRHASREDVSSDLLKKQRTEGLFDENLDNLEETTLKRTREDSPNTEEEILARNNQLRPVKKTKTPSYYAVLNSLSSSNNQYSSGVKRKASTLDLSRSGTPDVEKHFKPSETVQNIPKLSLNVVEPLAEVKKPEKNDLNEKSAVLGMKGILKGQTKKDTAVDQQQNPSLERSETIGEKKTEIQVEKKKNSSPVKNRQANFTDKLFMKAEPQANERLRTLIQEQGNIRAKFTSDDVDEIKKEDIVNMRQTSMKARLQSMFDAISGKPSKKINPDVIIHAEGTSEPNTTQSTPTGLVTLNSTTSTTNVNTSPIATSAVVPTIADSKLGKTTATKHVTFYLPSSESSATSESSSTGSNAFSGTVTSASETGKSNTEVPKLNFGTLVSSSSISTSPIVASGSTTLSFTNNQNTNNSTVPSSATSHIAPPSFGVATSSIQSSTQPLETTSVNITSTSNISSNLSPNISVAPKATMPSSSITFNSTTLGAGNLSSGLKKPIESGKTGTQTSSPMPNFSFGASKTSNASSVFGSNVQTSSINTQNQATTTNSTGISAIAPSFVPSNVARTQQSAFNTTSTTTGTSAPSLFQTSNSSTVPQLTSAGSFSFSTNANAGKGQVPAFGSTSAQGTPAFGGTGANQNPPPVFGSTINFQGNSTTATTQNTPLFGNNQNPPAFSSAVTTVQNNSTFGASASSAAPAPPAFGSSTSTGSSLFTFGNTAPPQTSTISGFGTNIISTTTSTATNFSTNATFSFGTSAATATTKPNFAFGSNGPATTSSNPGMVTTGQSNAFGAPAASNSTPVFGSSSTTAPPAFGATSTTATPVFGTPSTTTTSVFGSVSSTAIPAFGSTPSTTAPPLFGATATTTSSHMFAEAPNQSTFGDSSNSGTCSGFGPPKTTAPPAFGSQTNDPGFNYGGGNMGRNVLFSGTTIAASTSNTAAPTTAAPTFGGNTTSKSLFGQPTKSPPSFAASTSGTFGAGGTPSFGNPGPSFGSNGNSIPAGNPPAFGAQNSTTPGFGTQNQTVKQTPQGPPPAFGSTNSAFGSTTTAPPAFGANTSTSTGFGSSTNTFGTQNTTAPPSFGASTSNPAPAFGTNASSTPFGGQNQNSTPAFGTPNSAASSFGNNNNNPGTNFGFGNNQNQTPQNSAFSFNAATPSTNNNTTVATPFQFGGTSAKSEGFNFSASTTTPNISFGATAGPSFGSPAQGSNIFGTPSPAVPAGGMFSIGAGSTAPRSRSSRTTRRQR